MQTTGVVRHQIYLEHKTGILHPESPQRLESIYAMLDSRDFGGRLFRIEPRYATLSELLMVHDARYIDKVLASAEQSRVRFDPDTVTSPKTYMAAWLAAGGILSAIDAVFMSKTDNAFALVRPPGHHAERDRAMGFCIFNNLALGARYAQQDHGLSRVAVVDWDLHHGNGIQNIFYDDPNVLYFSMHRYPSYPWTGGVDEVGIGDGEGYTVNVPMEQGSSDADYANVFRHVLDPVMRQYQPDLVLVAAGFDTHHSDPLGAMNVTQTGFARMTSLLMDMAGAQCGGRLVLALEGGYNSQALRDSVEMVFWELTGQSMINIHELKDVENAQFNRIAPIIDKVQDIHGAYWSF
jgi:acetoin utilization deacetylase AcuC-like enzyme